jgi:hypothetical protein
VATLTLNIEVDTPGVGGLDTVTGKLKGMEQASSHAGGITTGVFQGIGQAVAGAGIGLAKAGLDMVIDKIGDSMALASTKAEAASKVNNLFGESAALVTEASKGSAEAVGLSSGAYLVAAGNLGNLTTNLGFTQEEAAKMSVDMVALAADMGSFNDASTEEVTEAMGAAFRGETEPIRRFGVILDDATVKAKAAEMGLYSGVGAIDANAKAQATYQLILEKTTAAQGDFAETSGGLANSQKIAAAQMDDAWTRVGEALTPIALQIMPLITDAIVMLADGIAVVIEWVNKWLADNKQFVDSMVELGRVIWDLYTRYIGALIATLGELGYRVGGIIGLFVDLIKAIVDAGGAIVKVLSGDFAGAAASAQMALDEVGSFAENVQRAMGDTGRKAADEALAAAAVTTQAAEESASGAINGLAGGYAAGVPEVAAAAGEVAGTIPDAMETAGTEAATIAAKTPGEIADAIRSSRAAPKSAMDQLREDLKSSISPLKEITQLEAMLGGKALAKGLTSTDPIVRGSAQQAVNTIEERLGELKGVGTDSGEDAGAGLQTGLGSEDPALRRVATSTNAVVTTQFDLLENGSRIAGNTASLTLASALAAGTTMVANAGENVAAAWGNALVRTINGYRDDVGRAAAYALAPIRGYSPPKVGPLKDIDKWGANIGGAWSEGVAKGIGPLGLNATPGAWPHAGGGASGGGAPSIIIQTGVGDPVAIGREVVDAIQAFERSGGRDWRAS